MPRVSVLNKQTRTQPNSSNTTKPESRNSDTSRGAQEISKNASAAVAARNHIVKQNIFDIMCQILRIDPKNKEAIKNHIRTFYHSYPMQLMLSNLEFVQEAIKRESITIEDNEVLYNFIDKFQDIPDSTLKIKDVEASCQRLKQIMDAGFLTDRKSVHRIYNFLLTLKNKCQDAQENESVQALTNSVFDKLLLDDFKRCLISNQYLMMMKMKKVYYLSQYSNLEFDIIRGMNNIVEGINPPIEEKTKEAILKEVFGDMFYETHKSEIKKISEEVNAMSAKEKRQELSTVQKALVFFMRSNGCRSKAENIKDVFDMFDEVYSQIMQGTDVEDPSHRAVELCFAKHKTGDGFQNTTYNYISILSQEPTWEALANNMKQPEKKEVLRSAMAHELTHYTQHILIEQKVPKNKLSQQGKKVLVELNKPYTNDAQGHYSRYLLHPLEMGAYTTEFLTGLERQCGVPCGDFCFLEKGTDRARRKQAKNIVEWLELSVRQSNLDLATIFSKPIYYNTSPETADCPIPTLTSTPAENYKPYPKLANLVHLFRIPNKAFANVVYFDEKLHIDDRLEGDESQIREALIDCFDYLLTYMIPRKDLKTIVEEAKPLEMSYIHSKSLVAADTTIQEQIDKCEELSQVYDNLLAFMQQQADDITYPKSDTLASLIKRLEDCRDVKIYNNNIKKVIEDFKDSKELKERIEEENKELGKTPVVAEYLHLIQIEIAQQLSPQMTQCLASEKIELLGHIISENEQILLSIPEFRDNYETIKEAIESYNSGDVKQQKKSLKTLKHYINSLCKNNQLKTYITENKEVTESTKSTLEDFKTRNNQLKTYITENKEVIESTKSTLQDLKTLKSQILYDQYNYERKRNYMFYIPMSSDDNEKTNRLNDFLTKVKKLPVTFQAQLSTYSDLAKAGIEKFSDWKKGLLR